MANPQRLMNYPPAASHEDLAEDEQQKKEAAKKLPKPKRPLSAYNIFYKYARDVLVSVDGDETKMEINATPEDVARLSLQDKKKPPKRVHCRTHGRMSFLDMARVVSTQWKQLPPEKKKVFEDQAKLEKQEYDRKVKEWKQLTKAEEKDDDSESGRSEESFSAEEAVSNRITSLSASHGGGQPDWGAPLPLHRAGSMPGNAAARGSNMDSENAAASFAGSHPMTSTRNPHEHSGFASYQPFFSSYAPSPAVMEPRPRTGMGSSLDDGQRRQEHRQEQETTFDCSDPLDPDEMDRLFD